MFAILPSRGGRLLGVTGKIITLGAERLALFLAQVLAHSTLPNLLNRSITKRITSSSAESMPEMDGPSA